VTATLGSATRAPAVPALMKAATIDRFGPPRVIKMHTLPVPELDAHDVLIAVHTAGVGSWDAKIRDGTWATGSERFPLVLGSDGAGTVVAKGPRVRRLGIGDRVWAYAYENPKGGFYAQYAAVDADAVAPVPPVLDLLHAGAAATTGLTAHQGIDDILRVRSSEHVLIFGATGGVGTLAVQFAARTGARVAGTARTRAGARLVRELGAETVFDPRRDDPRDALRALGSDGFDAVLALAGGPALERFIDLVRSNGRAAYPNGVEPEPRRRRNVRVVAYDATAGPREFARLARAVEDTRLRVPIAATYPLAGAARAHERLERGHVVGRIALRIRRSPS
jgi:NADPH2:quinone reductase